MMFDFEEGFALFDMTPVDNQFIQEYLPAAREIFERTWAAKDGGTVTMRYPEKEEKAWTSLC